MIGLGLGIQPVLCGCESLTMQISRPNNILIELKSELLVEKTVCLCPCVCVLGTKVESGAFQEENICKGLEAGEVSGILKSVKK